MKFSYSICHIDRPEVEQKKEFLDKEQVLSLVKSYPWKQELERMSELDNEQIFYSPSLDFKNTKDNHSFCLTAEGSEEDLEFSVWFNRSVKKKVLFGWMGEKEEMEVIDRCFKKQKAITLLNYFLEQNYAPIEKEMVP